MLSLTMSAILPLILASVAITQAQVDDSTRIALPACISEGELFNATCTFSNVPAGAYIGVATLKDGERLNIAYCDADGQTQLGYDAQRWLWTASSGCRHQGSALPGCARQTVVYFTFELRGNAEESLEALQGLQCNVRTPGVASSAAPEALSAPPSNVKLCSAGELSAAAKFPSCAPAKMPLGVTCTFSNVPRGAYFGIATLKDGMRREVARCDPDGRSRLGPHSRQWFRILSSACGHQGCSSGGSSRQIEADFTLELSGNVNESLDALRGLQCYVEYSAATSSGTKIAFSTLPSGLTLCPVAEPTITALFPVCVSEYLPFNVTCSVPVAVTKPRYDVGVATLASDGMLWVVSSCTEAGQHLSGYSAQRWFTPTKSSCAFTVQRSGQLEQASFDFTLQLTGRSRKSMVAVTGLYCYIRYFPSADSYHRVQEARSLSASDLRLCGRRKSSEPH